MTLLIIALIILAGLAIFVVSLCQVAARSDARVRRMFGGRDDGE